MQVTNNVLQGANSFQTALFFGGNRRTEGKKDGFNHVDALVTLHLSQLFDQTRGWVR